MSTVRTFRHAHLACGIGAGARGFNMANPRVGNVRARFECAGGIDVDAGAIANFEKLTGMKGTVMDLFDRPQYVAFHGREPPADWREATPADVHNAFSGNVDVCFASMPCKGFSGLLSQKQSETARYQALNGLTLRSIMLLLEAYKDEPIPIILFENVPRIANRGRWLLDQIVAVLRNGGYSVAETVHDCGELGGLAQSRKRFLLVARHMERVPPFVYVPPKRKLRGVGEVIGKLPLPGDPIAGAMHRVPALQWQTWVRLAFVPAGKDWRALNELEVVDGVLRDFGIVPEIPLRDNALGVCGWGDTAPLLTGARSPGQGRFSITDPRPADDLFRTSLGVTGWHDKAATIGSRGFPLNGAYSVADIRPGYGESTHRNVLGVRSWNQPAYVLSGSPRPTTGANSVADPRPPAGARNDAFGVRGWTHRAKLVAGESLPSNSAQAVADPRVAGHIKSVQLGVRPWGTTAPCVKGDMSVGTGPYAIADIRIEGRPRFNNTFRIVRYEDTANAVAGPGGPAGGQGVADPRMPKQDYAKRKYKVARYDQPTRAVIGASTTGDGAFAVADVRCTWGKDSHRNKLRVTPYDGRAGAVTGADRVGSGAPSVADKRRENYQTSGHYGVVGWGHYSGTVSATFGHDNGRGNVADPRPVELNVEPVPLPAAKDRLVCRIVSLDETWHRPFTTLELAALQSILDPEEVFSFNERTNSWQVRDHLQGNFDLAATSDATKREWIGNAVPSAASQAMATTIGETLLLAGLGESFTLSTREIWVKPLALALAVDADQLAIQMDGGRA